MIKNLFAIVLVSTILFGCQTVNSAIDDAKELQASVVEKVADVRGGIENVVTEAKDAYAALLEKKKQLEEMVAEINEAVDSINKLLGKEKSPAEIEDLQATIAELKNALDEAAKAIGEVKTAEKNLESGELKMENEEDLEIAETENGEVLTEEEVAEPAENEILNSESETAVE